MAKSLKWVVEVAGGQQWFDCLPDCRQVVLLLVHFVGGGGEGGKGWWHGTAVLWCRMDPARTLVAHHRRPGRISSDPNHFLQDSSLRMTFLYDRSRGDRYDRFFDDKLAALGIDLLLEESCI
jgi:hypothetical protein